MVFNTLLTMVVFPIMTKLMRVVIRGLWTHSVEGGVRCVYYIINNMNFDLAEWVYA